MFLTCFISQIKIVFVYLKVDPSLRSMMAVQQEYHSPSFLDLQSEITKKANNSGPKMEKQEPFKWSKLPGQASFRSTETFVCAKLS